MDGYLLEGYYEKNSIIIDPIFILSYERNGYPTSSIWRNAIDASAANS